MSVRTVRTHREVLIHQQFPIQVHGSSIYSLGDETMGIRNQALATPVTSRRSFVKRACAASVAIATGIAATAQPAAANGLIGYVDVQGAELFVHPTNLSAILYMDAGTPVDILYGPHNGMYEIRYYGTDGWIWAEYLSIGGSTASSGGGYSAPTSSYSEEYWIDVNRSSGLVRLMIGEDVAGAFWASLGFDTSDYGFYATALGTYYVYGFAQGLNYTAWADAWITDWVAFDPERYNGFHSYSKDQYGNILPNGAGKTGGCVALAPGDIDQLFDFAQMNMRVEIHW